MIFKNLGLQALETISMRFMQKSILKNFMLAYLSSLSFYGVNVYREGSLDGTTSLTMSPTKTLEKNENPYEYGHCVDYIDMSILF
jgi:hypothetical protein